MLGYIRRGDEISAAAVRELIASNRERLKIWSLPEYEKDKIQAEINELEDVLENPAKYGVTIKE